MITCDILYDSDGDIKQVRALRKALNEVYDHQFFFNSRTFKHKPMRV